VGLIGSSIYIGWTISSFILPRIADIIGRKPVFCLSMLIQTVAFIGLFFTKSIYLAYFIMFLFGVSSVGRTSISFLYLMEILPKAQQVLVGTILQLFSSLVSIIGCLYFW
jgi:MFS family permease